MIAAPQRRPVRAFLARHRATFAVALVVALASSGTAAAVSYLVLGTINTAGTTTTLKSAVNGAVLQLTNTNSTGGTNARGLGITVPTGRAPMTVNASAGKATNLDADMLDGLDSTRFARGTNVRMLANRLVLNSGEGGVELLALPGLGVLKGVCQSAGSGGDYALIQWYNTSSGNIDAWMQTAVDDWRLRAVIAPPVAATAYFVAFWEPASSSQIGDTLILGQGNSPGARRTATVTLAAFRTAVGAPCGLQATATVWSTP